MRLSSVVRSSVLAAALLAGVSRAPYACPGDGPEVSCSRTLASADAAIRASMERRDLARFESSGSIASEPSRFNAPGAMASVSVESCAPDVAPGNYSMLIELDPESHEWRLRAVPTPFEIPVDDPSLDRSAEGLVQEPLPGGGYKVDLRGRFMDHAVVRAGPDGRLIYDCISTTLDAESWMSATPAAAAPRKR